MKPRYALITGASRGIGAAIARRLARDGFNVLINYPGPAEAANAEEVLCDIRSEGGNGALLAADVSRVAAIRQMFETVRRQHPALHVLVNNAGICPFVEWREMTEAIWDKTHAVNLKGAYFCTQAAAGIMMDQKIKGRIISISSISALRGGAVQTHYCPTKGGLISMMAAFAVCLGPRGITCNSILPGTIETPINGEYLAAPKRRRHLEAQTCLGHLGKPTDVAGVAAFLAGAEAGYITGASILVDGGMAVTLL